MRVQETLKKSQKMVQIMKKKCIECGKEFETEDFRVQICSDKCRKIRNRRNSDKRYKERDKIRAVDQKALSPGDQVAVMHQIKGGKTKVKKTAKVMQCFEHYVMCNMGNYRECFTYNELI